MARRRRTPPRLQLRNDRLRQAREDRDWTQRDLALRIGRHPASISPLEQGRTLPSPPQLKLLAEVLEVDVRWLVPLPADPTLKELRHVAGHHGSAIAEATGVPLSSLSHIEGGSFRPSDPDAIATWARMLDVTVEEWHAAWERGRRHVGDP